MLNKYTSNVINVYGDSLDACVYTRTLSEKFPNRTIVHYSSGEFGGIYSNKNGMLGLLSENRMRLISSYIDAEFIPVTESYVKVPYNKLKIKNTTDGNIRFPITKKSFEFEYDYDDVILSTPTYEEFIEEYSNNKNIVKVMKKIFNDSFYTDVIKKIGTNIFDTIQSQLDARYLYKTLFNMESLQLCDYFIYYCPVGGYDSLCRKLLENSNIKTVITDRVSIKKSLENNDQNYLFDYFDYYLDYIYGGIEYTKFTPKEYKKTLFNTDQISRIYTPYDKNYGIYYQIESTIYSVETSKYFIKSNNFSSCIPTPSQTNFKKISQYLELVSNIPNMNIIF